MNRILKRSRWICKYKDTTIIKIFKLFIISVLKPEFMFGLDAVLEGGCLNGCGL
jgi:uncharacterized protein YehS (DUF1456 family)